MPIIYRRRSPSFSDAESDLENIAPPPPPDADDSIILSGLVRTGEASRLRRRGAMRLDHGHIAQEVHLQAPSPTVVVDSPPWDSEPEEAQGGAVLPRERLRTIRRGRPRRAAGDEEMNYTYTLFCGSGDDQDSGGGFAGQPCVPFEPSLLPLFPQSSSCGPSLSSRKKISNGCGAVLHLSAAPRRRQATWLAKDDATGVVIPMDATYFDKEAASKIVRNACGCLREGVGCAVCGNPLGIRYIGCKASGDGTTHLPNKPSASSPVAPEGPRYWRALDRHSTPLSTYTFFHSAVSSFPSHKFPPRSQIPEARSSIGPPQDLLGDREQNSYNSDGIQPTYNNTMFDRIITASPSPLSDLGEGEGDRSYRVDATPRNLPFISTQGFPSVYDPDGEFLMDAEPNSPDKTNDPILLFPER